MSTKQILAVLGVLIVLGLVFAWLATFTKPATPELPPEPTSPVLHGTATSTGDFALYERGDGYEITVLYPSVTGLDVDADLRARTAIERGLADIINVFKSDAVTMITPDELARLQSMGVFYALGITYKEYESPSTVSYQFDIYQDTGGAHPNGFYKTFTFDRQGNLLALGDLFEPGSRYLDRLSQLIYPKVVAELEARSDTKATPDMLDTVRVGTSPSPEALQFYYLTDTDLHLLFPPYQVAAYVAGSFDIPIPLSDLSDILKK